MSILKYFKLERKPKFKDDDFDPLKGRVVKLADSLTGWGKDTGKYRSAVQTAEGLRAKKIKEAGKVLLQAKTDAENELALALGEYQTAKDTIVKKLQQLQSHAQWNHVEDEVKTLNTTRDGDALILANAGTDALRMMRDLQEPYRQALQHAEAYQGVVDKKGVVETKIAELGKPANMATHLAVEITSARNKIAPAMAKADPPGRDYGGALASLGDIEADCLAAQRLAAKYQEVLDAKAKKERLITALGQPPIMATHLAAEILVIQSKVTTAMAKVEPAGRDYTGALVTLNTIDGDCNAAKLLATQYQAVLNKKALKEARIGKLKKNSTLATQFATEVEAMTNKVAAAMLKVEPAGRDYTGASNDLDAIDGDGDSAELLLTDFQNLLDKKELKEALIADLSKHATLAANIPVEIANATLKVTNAMARANPPGRDYAGASTDLDAVDADCLAAKELMNRFQLVLNKKADTEVKLARLENHEQAGLVQAEAATARSHLAPAMLLAASPTHNYQGAQTALRAIDKECAEAEMIILDRAYAGKWDIKKRSFLKKQFKERFGVKLKAIDKSEGGREADEAIKRMYLLMAMVPESHATNNPSLLKVTRIGGDEGGSYYQPEGWKKRFLRSGVRVDKKKVVMANARPGAAGGDVYELNKLSELPDVAEDKYRVKDPGNVPTYFDWTAMHELGHSVDDRFSIMGGTRKADANWGSPTLAQIALAVGTQENFATPEALRYIEELLDGQSGYRPDAAERPPKPDTVATQGEWDTRRTAVEDWVDAVRVDKELWDDGAGSKNRAIGATVYHEAYDGDWVSYDLAARTKGFTGYQFRAPGEWFSELYAAYHTGKMKETHPAAAWLAEL